MSHAINPDLITYLQSKRAKRTALSDGLKTFEAQQAIYQWAAANFDWTEKHRRGKVNKMICAAFGLRHGPINSSAIIDALASYRIVPVRSNGIRYYQRYESMPDDSIYAFRIGHGDKMTKTYWDEYRQGWTSSC